MQRHEILAWLGDDHTLTSDQLDEFTTAASEIEQQYPDTDDQDEAQAALIAAYRLLVEDQASVVSELSAQLASARRAELLAVAGLKQAANQLIGPGQRSESGFAREAGVDRMTVRAWRGKRTVTRSKLPMWTTIGNVADGVYEAIDSRGVMWRLWCVWSDAPGKPPLEWRFAPVEALDRVGIIEHIGGGRALDIASMRIDAREVVGDQRFRDGMGLDEPTN